MKLSTKINFYLQNKEPNSLKLKTIYFLTKLHKYFEMSGMNNLEPDFFTTISGNESFEEEFHGFSAAEIQPEESLSSYDPTLNENPNISTDEIGTDYISLENFRNVPRASNFRRRRVSKILKKSLKLMKKSEKLYRKALRKHKKCKKMLKSSFQALLNDNLNL